MWDANKMSHFGVRTLTKILSIVDTSASRKVSLCPGGALEYESEDQETERPNPAAESTRRVACQC